MRALVFGGLHYIGSHVVAELGCLGHDVCVIDFEDPDETVDPASDPGETVADPAEDASEHEPDLRVPVQLIKHGLRADPSGISLKFDPADFDVTLLCGVETALGEAEEVPCEQDLVAERRVVDLILAAGPRAVVLTSSAGVYSLGTGSVHLDETSEVVPGTRLGAHALSLEEALVSYSSRTKTPYLILRTAIVSGAKLGVSGAGRACKAVALLPGLGVERLYYPFAELRMDEGETSGRPRLADFVHISDVAAAHALAAAALTQDGELQRILNVGTGATITLDEAMPVAREAVYVRIRGGRSPAGTGAPAVTVSGEEAHRLLGWTPGAPAESIVASEVALFRKRLLTEKRIGLEVRVGNEYLASFLTSSHLTILGVLIADDAAGELRTEDFLFRVNKSMYKARFVPLGGLRLPGTGIRLCPYRLRIPMTDLELLSVQNPVKLTFVGSDGRWFDRRLTYSLLRSRPDNRRGRLFSLHGGESTLYLRQTDTNRLFITSRVRNVTDSFRKRLIIRVARWASLLRRERPVLLYEKEGTRYEESAAVVFEEMIDRGMEDVRYILSPEMIDGVPDRYRRYIVPRFSFRHFYYFFGARTFIGTETVFSAAELRSADRRLMSRISRQDYRFVFLQHGVMYMVALSARQRRFFRAGVVFPLGTKIVVSSKREADHFVELGGFSRQDLYVCGLPKLDRACLDPGADRILIMPTWRPWEHNLVRTRPTESLYYQMLVEMFEAIPDDLRDRTCVLPHPLVRDALSETDLREQMWTETSYDEALRSGVLLITDYSSISYDAFYRGANVIFWWKDKEECMRRYGGHLMLEERTSFGPVCYDSATLSDLVRSTYGKPQDAEYVRRYREIVEFHDGRNTARLIEMMRRDGLI